MVEFKEMLINVRVLGQNVIGRPTAESYPTNEAHPKSLALVAFLAERYDRRLLVVPTKRTGVGLPAF